MGERTVHETATRNDERRGCMHAEEDACVAVRERRVAGGSAAYRSRSTGTARARGCQAAPNSRLRQACTGQRCRGPSRCRTIRLGTAWARPRLLGRRIPARSPVVSDSNRECGKREETNCHNTAVRSRADGPHKPFCPDCSETWTRHTGCTCPSRRSEPPSPGGTASAPSHPPSTKRPRGTPCSCRCS